MIHTFSPNWYKPQCLFFDNNYLFYTSNYVLYRYNLDSRKVQCDKCFRKIAMKTGMNSKDIKIHTIKKMSSKIHNQQVLVIGTNQPHAVIVQPMTFNVIAVVRDIGVSSVNLCYTGYQEQDNSPYAFFVGENGEISKIIMESPTQFKVVLINGDTLPKDKIKQIMQFQHLNILIYGKGEIALFNENFSKAIQELPCSVIGLDQQYILTFDTWQDGPILWAAMLTRTKNNSSFLHFCSITVKQQNKNELLLKSVLKSQVKVLYPKAMNEKLKNAQKAAITIKLLSPTSLLLSGKLGQIFIIDLTKCPQTLSIKPQSIQDIDACVEILNDSKHYKQIYGIYLHKRNMAKAPQLFTISTDQTMNIWSVVQKQNTIQLNYSIKFVTAQLTSIFFSEADPKTVFFLLKDSNIRSASPLSQNSYFLNQYWKFTKKYKIVKAVAHLEEPGISAMVTQCGKVLIYDLFDDRMMRLYQITNNPSDQIINISFEYKTILKPIHELAKAIEPDIENNWKPQNIKANRYYNKTIKNGTQIGVLVQQKSRFMFICQKQKSKIKQEGNMMEESQMGDNQQKQKQKQGLDEIVCIKRVGRIQRVHNTKLWDNSSLISSQCKNNSLKLWVYYQEKVMKLQTNLKFGGRCIFKIDHNLLRIVEYKTKKICLYAFNLSNQFKKISQVQLQISLYIEQTVLDYFSCQAIFYNGKDDSLVHLQFDNSNAKATCYEIGNKIQSLSFYISQYLAIGFKDQSIKVLKIEDMQCLKDQPQKKVKKTVESYQQSEMQDQKMEQGNKPSVNMMSLDQ